ncbi:MAG: hypothetical protein HY722_04790 [Planctomycetes bacterium]|nr:hypothetical protein [Planctomycetota bacterium]
MGKRRCLRTLDDPVEILGLEPEDWLVLMVVGAVLFVANGIVAVAFVVAGFLALRAIKRGKPAGYLFYLAYRSGLTRLLPPSRRPPHLLAQPWPWQRPMRVKYSAALHAPAVPTWWASECLIVEPEEERA